jgi:hypothetical protein
MRDAVTLVLGVTKVERSQESWCCETAPCEEGRSLEDIRVTSLFEDIRVTSSFENIRLTSLFEDIRVKPLDVGDLVREVRIELNLKIMNVLCF